jgi:osmotically-inducible protein OsmY
VLADLPGYSVFDCVTFHITDGRVVLAGSILHPEEKQEAEQAISSIPGVTAVENAFEILPQSS